MRKLVNNGQDRPAKASKRAPGRPRSERAREAILSSTLLFLEDWRNSFADLTIEHVAEAAEVGKATVYRWWPTKAALVADAFAGSVTKKLHFPDTGSVARDMNLQMRQLVKILRSRRGNVVSALLGAGQSDSTLLAAFRERFLKPRRAEAYATLRRGIERGELSASLDLDLLLDALYGPIYMRFLIRHDPLSPEFVDQICATIFLRLEAEARAKAHAVRRDGNRRQEGKPRRSGAGKLQRSYSLQRRKTSEPLVPPKPKELESA
jgi:AcrR family transcriptional regulator